MGKEQPGRVADHSSPPSAAVMEEKSYTSITLLGHIRPVKVSLYLFTFIQEFTIHFLTKTHITSIEEYVKIYWLVI